MFSKPLFFLVPNIKSKLSAIVLLNIIGLFCNIMVMLFISRTLVLLYVNQMLLTSDLIFLGAGILVSGGIRFLCSRRSVRRSFALSCEAKQILTNKIYDKLTRIGPSYADSVSTSEITQVSVEGVNQLEIYFGQYLPQLFYSLTAPIILFFVLLPVSPKAAIILLICVPLIPLSIVFVQKFAKRVFGQYWNSYTSLGSIFLENLQGLTTLKIYQADEAKHKEMREGSENFRKATMRVLTMQLNSITVMDLVAFGGAAIGIAVAVSEFSKEHITLFGIVLTIFLSAEFFLPLRLLGSFFHTAMNGISAANKIFAILNLPETEQGRETIQNKLDLTFEHLSFTYSGDKKILEDVNLAFPEKSFTAIVGQSGCGKSTIANLISGKLKDYTGSITIGGQPLTNIGEKSLREHITLVRSNSYIFNGTIEYNLKLACPSASPKEMMHVLSLVQLKDLVACENDLKRPIAEGGTNLSGGQRQRLAIARALLKDSPIYIFDEATSNVDAQSEDIIMNVIKQLSGKKTIILISHRLYNVKECNPIYVLENGKIVEWGNHETLLQNKNVYSNLYQTQMQLEQYSNGEVSA